jgi:large subunit ribosomal protein L18
MPRLTTETRRKLRSRRRLKTRRDTERLRLTVFRSSKHIYAQIIDESRGHTVAEANSRTLAAGGQADGKKVEKAKAVGQALAERAKAQGVTKVVFDRGSYRYHGRVKALADGAREGGLEF